MDPYLRLVSSTSTMPGRLARNLAKRLGLPTPVRLRRHTPGTPLVPGAVHCGGTGGRLLEPTITDLHARGVELRHHAGDETDSAAGAIAADQPPYAVLFDASGITNSSDLHKAYAFLHPWIRRIEDCGRLLILGSVPDHCATVAEATAQSALDGLMRSAAKELGLGSTANLVRVPAGAEQAIAGPLGFLLSAKSAFVSGQTWQLQRRQAPAVLPDPTSPSEGRTVLVTGAARGIGAQIARTLARDGATVACLDRGDQHTPLEAVATEIGGVPFELDISDDRAPDTLADRLAERFGGVHAVVHNAGVLRDRTLGKMSATEWDTVLAVNLTAQERLDPALLDRGLLHPDGRLISLSSVSGIAGNRGQTNYATSKAGVIGRVGALAARPTECSLLPAGQQHAHPPGLTVNAVAPGFIETTMTGSMPAVTREVGRRLSSLGQAGLPVDVAETVAFLASPAAYAVHGNVIRVCGQSMLGA